MEQKERLNFKNWAKELVEKAEETLSLEVINKKLFFNEVRNSSKAAARNKKVQIKCQCGHLYEVTVGSLVEKIRLQKKKCYSCCAKKNGHSLINNVKSEENANNYDTLPVYKQHWVDRVLTGIKQLSKMGVVVYKNKDETYKKMLCKRVSVIANFEDFIYSTFTVKCKCGRLYKISIARLLRKAETRSAKCASCARVESAKRQKLLKRSDNKNKAEGDYDTRSLLITFFTKLMDEAGVTTFNNRLVSEYIVLIESNLLTDSDFKKIVSLIRTYYNVE